MTDGGLGAAFFAPFDNKRYFLPWRPIQVSPISVHRFFTPRGFRHPAERSCLDLASRDPVRFSCTDIASESGAAVTVIRATPWSASGEAEGRSLDS
jgi:hypothetical protein